MRIRNELRTQQKMSAKYYPGCPEKPDWMEIGETEWEAYCRDMEEMRREYERLVFGEEDRYPF